VLSQRAAAAIRSGRLAKRRGRLGQPSLPLKFEFRHSLFDIRYSCFQFRVHWSLVCAALAGLSFFLATLPQGWRPGLFHFVPSGLRLGQGRGFWFVRGCGGG